MHCVCICSENDVAETMQACCSAMCISLFDARHTHGPTPNKRLAKFLKIGRIESTRARLQVEQNVKHLKIALNCFLSGHSVQKYFIERSS